MKSKSTRQAYGEALVELGKINKSLVVLDADLAHATMTNIFKEAFPERHYNIGIAEANMVDIAGGMSTAGLIPFCSTFAMFGTGRVYEQIRNSVAYAKLNVKLAMTHGGVTVGEDGGSHQCIEDIALMRVIPGMTVLCPADANEAREAVFAAAELNGPVYMRFARCASPVFEGELVKPFKIGKANVLRDGEDIAIFTYGLMVAEALKAAEELKADGISAAVINMHTIKPLDKDCLIEYAKKCKALAVVEEASIIGGLGEAIASVLLSEGLCPKFQRIGIEDRFGQSGPSEELLYEYGISAKQIHDKLLSLI